MALPSLRQRVTQSLLVTSLVFASALGYWSVSIYAVPSADSAPSNAALSVATSSAAQGDPITFTLKNTFTDPISLTNGAPYAVSQNDVTVYSPIASQVFGTLSSGQSKSWTWSQKNNDSVQVAPGVYTITVSYQLGGQSQTSSVLVTVKEGGTSVNKVVIGFIPLIAGATLLSAALCYFIIKRPHDSSK